MPTCVDYIFYQELLTAMIVSKLGTESDFMASDPDYQEENVPNLVEWYKIMGTKVEKCKNQAWQFMNALENNNQQNGIMRRSTNQFAEENQTIN